ncbi:MAG: hypothetical protein Q9214_007595, partial [Letrouitia sp. 1 TL-2023]
FDLPHPKKLEVHVTPENAMELSKKAVNEFPHVPKPGPLRMWYWRTVDQYPKHAVSTFEHCELTLALELKRRFLNANPAGIMIIGTSEPSCVWCQKYPAPSGPFSKSEDMNVVIRHINGKEACHWQLPLPGISDEYTDRFLRDLISWWKNCCDRRASGVRGEIQIPHASQ